jgi:hypothetical protein
LVFLQQQTPAEVDVYRKATASMTRLQWRTLRHLHPKGYFKPNYSISKQTKNYDVIELAHTLM